MVTILMMLAKIATPDLLKMKDFEIKVMTLYFFAHDVTNKALSRDSNYIVDVVM